MSVSRGSSGALGHLGDLLHCRIGDALPRFTCAGGSVECGVRSAGAPGIGLGHAVIGDRANLASSVVGDGGGIGGVAGFADAGQLAIGILGEQPGAAAFIDDLGRGSGGVRISDGAGGGDVIAAKRHRIAIDLAQVIEFGTAAFAPAGIADYVGARPDIADIFRLHRIGCFGSHVDEAVVDVAG